MAKFSDTLVPWERAAALTLYGASLTALSSAYEPQRLWLLAAVLAAVFIVGYRADLGRAALLRRAAYPVPDRTWGHLLGAFFVLLLVAVTLMPGLLLGMLFVFPLFITAPGMQAAMVFLDACLLAFGVSDEHWIGDIRVAVFAVFLGATFSLHHHCERVRKSRAPYRATALSLLLRGAFFGALASGLAFPLHFLVPSLSPSEARPAQGGREPTMRDLLLLLLYFGIVGVLFGVLLRILQRFKFTVAGPAQLEHGSATVVSQTEMSKSDDTPSRPKEPRWAVVKLYHALFKRLRPAGVLAPSSSTPTERMVPLARRAPDRTEEIEALTELFHRARYSREQIDQEDVRRMRAWTDAVRRGVMGAGAALALWAGTADAQDVATMNRLARAITYKAHTYDVLDYDLEVSIDNSARTIRVRCRVRIEMKKDADTIRFLIHRNARIEAVSCDDRAWRFSLSRFVAQLPVNLFDLTPPAPITKGKRLDLVIVYQIPSRGKSPELHAPTVLADWAWVDLASGWYPLMLHETFTSRIALDLPGAWDGVATGTLESSEVVSGRRRMVFGGKQQNTFLGFIGGRYHRRGREAGGRRLSTLTVNEIPEQLADLVFRQTDELFQYYRSLYGDPEVSDFTLVEMPPENPSNPHNARTYAVLTQQHWGSAAIEKARSIWYSSLSHEIAHCWFGHLVPSDVLGRGGNWLREGLSEYSSYLALAKEFGPGPWIYRRAIATYQSDLAVLGGREPPLREMTYMLDRDTSYEKGAWVFRMLRHEVGAEAFDRALARYVAERRGGFATDTDFRAVVEMESGLDLKPFFATWVEGTGRFDLALAAGPARLADGRWTVRAEPGGTIRQPTRVELRWRTETGKEGACDVEIPAEGGDLVVPCDGRPAWIELDARNDYFDVDPWNNTWPPRVRSGLRAIFPAAIHTFAWVIEVEPGSPADRAGLCVGDLITTTDGREIASPDDLPAALWGLHEGGSLRLGVRRDGKKFEVELK